VRGGGGGGLEGLSPHKNIQSPPKNHAEPYIIILINKKKYIRLLLVNILSIQLQSKSATLGNSTNLIKGVINTLQSYRSSIHYSELWEKLLYYQKTCN